MREGMGDVRKGQADRDKEKTGVLIIHGFGGSPAEVAELARHLSAGGFRISVPRLPGHGREKGKLGKVSWRQWISAVEQAYEELAAQCVSTFVVGFSMGGLLAVHMLAADFSGVSRQDERLGGLVTVNTPVYYWNVRQMVCNMLFDGRSGDWARRYLRSADRLSLGSMLQFQRLLSTSKGLYRRLYCPTLVIQLSDDDTVWPVSGDYILRRLRGRRVLLKLPRGGHQVFQSSCAAQVCEVIEQFLSGEIRAFCPRKS